MNRTLTQQAQTGRIERQCFGTKWAICLTQFSTPPAIAGIPSPDRRPGVRRTAPDWGRSEKIEKYPQVWPLRSAGAILAGLQFSIMATRPELTIGYDLHARPSSARCSVCGASMPPIENKALTSAERVRRFAAHFNLHVQQVHPHDYEIQTASPWTPPPHIK